MDSTLPTPLSAERRSTRIPHSLSSTSATTKRFLPLINFRRQIRKSTYRSRHSFDGSCPEKSNRTSSSIGSSLQLHQSNLHGPEEDGRSETGLQLEDLKSICRLSPFQNGDNTRYCTNDQTQRLFSFNRPVRRFSTPSSSSRFSQISSLPLARSTLSISNHSFWSKHRSVLVHQDNTTNCGVGSGSGHPSSCLPRRLDYHGRIEGHNSQAYCNSLVLFKQPRVDCESREIESTTHSTDRTSGIYVEYKHNAGLLTWEETPGPTEIPATSLPPSSPNTSQSAEPNHAASGSNLCTVSGPSVHATPPVPEEQMDAIRPSMGHPANLEPFSAGRDQMVDRQLGDLERPFHDSLDGISNVIRRRIEYGMGMLIPRPDSLRSLDSQGE